jgi:hypothetical protein
MVRKPSNHDRIQFRTALQEHELRSAKATGRIWRFALSFFSNDEMRRSGVIQAEIQKRMDELARE